MVVLARPPADPRRLSSSGLQFQSQLRHRSTAEHRKPSFLVLLARDSPPRTLPLQML